MTPQDFDQSLITSAPTLVMGRSQHEEALIWLFKAPPMGPEFKSPYVVSYKLAK